MSISSIMESAPLSASANGVHCRMSPTTALRRPHFLPDSVSDVWSRHVNVSKRQVDSHYATRKVAYMTCSRLQSLPTATDGSFTAKFKEAVDKIPAEDRSGEASPEMKALLEEIDQAGQKHDYYEIAKGGRFRQVFDTLKLMGDGKGVTLGTLSFNQFGPQKQQLETEQNKAGGVYQAVNSEDEYAIVTAFKVADGEHKGLQGLFTVSGNYTADDDKPYRQKINFCKLRLEPQDSNQLDRWLAFAKESNASMDKDGVAVVELPKPFSGWRDFVYVDEGANFQITRGNLGSYVALQRDTE